MQQVIKHKKTHKHKENKKNIVFYDGECGLCSNFVRFVFQFDRNKNFYFCALQSQTAHNHLREYNITNIRYDTVYVTCNGTVSSKSKAVITVLKHLSPPLLRFSGHTLSFIPPFIRDWGYDIVATHRHRLLKQQCNLPPTGLRERILNEPL